MSDYTEKLLSALKRARDALVDLAACSLSLTQEEAAQTPLVKELDSLILEASGNKRHMTGSSEPLV